MPRRELLLVFVVCALLAGGAVAAVVLSSGEGDADAGSPGTIDARVEYVDEPPGDRICQALPSFGNDRLRLRQFVRAVRRLTDKPQVTVAWLIDADTTADKDELARSLGRARFGVDAGRFDGGSYGVRATRRTSLNLPSLVREKDALLRASSARSDRTILMVAYPQGGCEDLGPAG